MSDFDFDEIDKAVTGALTPDDSSLKDASKERTDERVESRASAAKAVPARGESEEVKEVSKVAPAARRSSGRFMDVVHPSSDMRTSNASFTPPRRAPQPSSRPETSIPARDDEAASQPEEQEAWAQPLESPFLPDAKVEKRPLGAFSETSSIETEIDADVDAAEESAPEQQPPIIEEQDELLLEAPDDLRLEATTLPDPIDFAAHSSAPSTESEDTGSSAEPASISQQYTEQPSSAPASGAIYDTEAYHQPLAPAPKKKGAGVLSFIWIVILIILGAGAGVAFYFFALPLL